MPVLNIAEKNEAPKQKSKFEARFSTHQTTYHNITAQLVEAQLTNNVRLNFQCLPLLGGQTLHVSVESRFFVVRLFFTLKSSINSWKK